MRRTADPDAVPAVDIAVPDYDTPVAAARDAVDRFSRQGYAAADDAVAATAPGDRSPVYSVDVVLPEQRVDGTPLEADAYTDPAVPRDWTDHLGTAVDDPHRSPAALFDALADGRELELRAMAYACDDDTTPTYRVEQVPLPVDLPHRDANEELLQRVDRAVERSRHDLLWYECLVRVGGFDTPAMPLRMLDGAEAKAVAAVDLACDADRYVDVGYLVSPENDSTAVGIAVRRSAEAQAGTGPGDRLRDDGVRTAVADLETELEREGLRLSGRRRR
ncbi:MAG: hypothetical protein SVU88_00660 [Candidatus Nanohaloarchaea archaeon]|nr:hypothetical protein [Candidatus Nanohaloarchaea archaeon]